MIIRIDTDKVRSNNVQLMYTAHAIGLGFSLSEARTRAKLWFEFESIAVDRDLMTVEAMSAGGQEDYRAVEKRTLPTADLKAMVDTLRDDPRPPQYFRHGWGAGPHGLQP